MSAASAQNDGDDPACDATDGNAEYLDDPLSDTLGEPTDEPDLHLGTADLAPELEGRESGSAPAEGLEFLIGRIMRQDEAALGSLYQRLNGPVYSLALRITRNESTAEEVLQDVFWQVWQQAPRFDASRGSAIAWVLTLTRSRALDAARRLMRPVNAQGQSSEDMDDLLASPDAGPQDLLFAAQQGSRLQVALQALEPLRRQLISLSFYLGQTQQEIADHMGLPLGTVKSHMRRGLLALREALGDDVRNIEA